MDGRMNGRADGKKAIAVEKKAHLLTVEIIRLKFLFPFLWVCAALCCAE